MSFESFDRDLGRAVLGQDPNNRPGTAAPDRRTEHSAGAR